MIYISCNWELLNRVNYNNPKVIKNILYHYDDLMVMARKGDQVSAVVCFDVKRAIHTRGVLTFKQRRYLSLWWQGHNTIEIATIFSVEKQTVWEVLGTAFRRISKYLNKKTLLLPVEPYCNYRKGEPLWQTKLNDG